MKNLTIKFGVALLTFLIGNMTTWLYQRAVPLLNIKEGGDVSFVTQEANPQAELKTPAGQGDLLHLDFLGFNLDKGRRYAEFRFTNPVPEKIYYIAYSKGDMPIYRSMTKRYVWSEPMSWTFCGTGLQDFGLLENESITFRVPVPEKARALKVGIQLVRGQERNHVEVWSKEIDVSMPSGALSNNSFNRSAKVNLNP